MITSYFSSTRLYKIFSVEMYQTIIECGFLVSLNYAVYFELS